MQLVVRETQPNTGNFPHVIGGAKEREKKTVICGGNSFSFHGVGHLVNLALQPEILYSSMEK